MDEDIQERAIKSAHKLARWIQDMPKYGCTAKVMNIQIGVDPKIRLVFKYTSTNDRLVARKIMFK